MKPSRTRVEKAVRWFRNKKLSKEGRAFIDLVYDYFFAKDEEAEREFELWWKVYPKTPTMSRKKALESWLRSERPDVERMIKVLNHQKSYWSSGDHPVPHATTYLNQERWVDETFRDRDHLARCEVVGHPPEWKQMFIDMGYGDPPAIWDQVPKAIQFEIRKGVHENAYAEQWGGTIE